MDLWEVIGEIVQTDQTQSKYNVSCTAVTAVFFSIIFYISWFPFNLVLPPPNYESDSQNTRDWLKIRDVFFNNTFKGFLLLPSV